MVRSVYERHTRRSLLPGGWSKVGHASEAHISRHIGTWNKIQSADLRYQVENIIKPMGKGKNSMLYLDEHEKRMTGDNIQQTTSSTKQKCILSPPVAA
jgi:hypothetical protein